MSDVKKAMEDGLHEIDEALAGYNRVLVQFRSTIKNDLSSLAASAAKVQAENAKIAQACRAVIEVMTSPDMEEAIANAERLANALKAISELKSHNITFAVLGRKPDVAV